MSFNLHQAGGRRLSERGFGKNTKGKATVIALYDGSPATMQPTILFNKAFGGTTLIIPEANIHPSVRGKSYLYTGTTVHELYVDRGANDVGTVSVTSHKVGKETIEQETCSCGFFLQEGRVSFVSCCDMEETSDRAKHLIDKFLFNAFAAAIKRSFDPSPRRLYYGNLANDASLYIQQPREFVKNEEMTAATETVATAE